MKKAALVLSLILLLAGCSKTTSQSKDLFVPSFCEKTKILQSLPKSLQGSSWIDTSWELTKGSDLEAALGEGGLACEFGIGTGEVGTTILWSPNDGYLFTQQSAQWIKNGQKKIDLPGLDETSAFVKTEGVQGSGEYHVWTINLLYKDFWIQVNASFADSVEKLMPLVKAAIDSLQSKSEMKSANISGCYAVTVNGDLLAMKLDQQDRNIVIADIYFGYTKKNSTEGRMFANYTNGVLTGLYEVQLLDKKQKTELFFRGDKSGFNQGSSQTVQINGEIKFKRPLQINWDTKNTFVASDKCQPLNLK